MKRLLAVVMCLLPVQAWAFSGRVVSVGDGDTFTVERGGDRQRVRVFGIDAPESDQPGGTVARLALDRMIYGQVVEVEPPPGEARFPHSYDRIVGVVTGPGGADIGLTMIGLGDAWAYAYFHPPRAYGTAMERAAHARLNLWAAPAPVAPWEWRRTHKRDW